ncbi:MAG: hypothetical protein BZY81_08500 [SAR202 cluster bacterium Io17-Chloro-G4]|nr:MAG: hypothetical protein BZY81_08500 [SAR202 cluster bacterium Io17-Chloro-G4]
MPFTPKRVVLALVASLVAAGLVVVAMGLMGEYTKTGGRFLVTALALSGVGLLALPPSVLSQQTKYRNWGYTGVGIAGGAYLLVVGGVWGTPDSDAYWKAAGISGIAAGSMTQICWLLLMTPRDLVAKAAWLIAGSATGLVPLVAGIGIIAEIRASSFWWAVTLIVIAQVLAGIAAPILNRWPNRS